MIHANRVITVGDRECDIDKPIILYRGDKEVAVEFEIIGDNYMFSNDENVIRSMNASHGQLVLNTPSGRNQFAAVSECNEGKVVFVIREDMIDELTEVGYYSFQIRLFDGEAQSSRVTLPPVIRGIDIRNPIASEDVEPMADAGLADMASLMYASEGGPLDVFTESGEYIKTVWKYRDTISSEKLNKIESGIDGVNRNAKNNSDQLTSQMNQLQTSTNASINSLQTSINGQLSALETEIDSKLTTLETEVVAELDGKITSLQTSVNTDIGAKLTTLENKHSDDMETVESALEAIIDMVNDVQTGVGEEFTWMLEAIEDLLYDFQNRLESLERRVTALEKNGGGSSNGALIDYQFDTSGSTAVLNNVGSGGQSYNTLVEGEFEAGENGELILKDNACSVMMYELTASRPFTVHIKAAITEMHASNEMQILFGFDIGAMSVFKTLEDGRIHITLCNIPNSVNEILLNPEYPSLVVEELGSRSDISLYEDATPVTYTWMSDGQVMYLFINGEAVAGQETWQMHNTMGFFLGDAMGEGDTCASKIAFSEIKIFEYALTPEEIRALALGN